MRTFGSLEFTSDGWAFTNVEPHVVMRAKRIFAGLKQHKAAVLKLSDTTENARDLEWFLERYPLTVTDQDRAHLTRRADAYRERTSLLERLLSGVEKPQAFELAVPPRDYQRTAAQLWLTNGGLLLGDDIGLGKTVSAICGLTDPRTRPALVVTDTHLMRQWEAMVGRFAPQLRTHIIRTGPIYDLTAPKGRKKKATEQLEIEGVRKGLMPDVVITCYSRLAKWADTLAPVVQSVVYDEVQSLRHGASTAKGVAAVRLSALPYRLGLTATPIYNQGSEIHPVLDVLCPGALGSRDEFLREWCGAVDQRGNARVNDPKALGSFLRESGFMVRRTKTEVGMELPPVIKVPHEIDTDLDVFRDLSSDAERLASTIIDRASSRAARFEASGQFDALMRQATGVAKAPYVAEFVRLLAQDEPVVLFGWHHDCYNIWRERLKALNPVFYTGSESPAQREASLEAFKKGDSRVFVMSLRSGAGLNGLQEVSRLAVFGELDWSPAALGQCTGRLDRDGQERQVVAYYLLSSEGSDPPMMDTLGIKFNQSEGLINPSGNARTEVLEVDGKRIREMAERYLRGRAQPLRNSAPVI